MNFHALNGAPLNGSRVGAILAAATILCSATVTAVGVRQRDALAPSSSSAQFTATALVTRAGGADFGGSAGFDSSTIHTQAAAADLGGTASIQAFVLRESLGFAEFICTANITAIPASILANSLVDPSASLVAEATKVQPGRSLAPASGALVSADPVVTRYVTASALLCQADLNVEPSVNGVAYSYAKISASGDLAAVADGLVMRPGSAWLMSSAQMSVVETHVKPGVAAFAAIGAILAGEPHIEVASIAAIDCASSVTAAAVRQLRPVAILAGAANISAPARQRHGSAAATVAGSAAFAAIGLARRPATSQTLSASADLLAAGTREAVPFADLHGSAVIVAAPWRITYAASSPTGTADINAASDITIREAAADIDCGVAIEDEAVREAVGVAAMACSAELVAIGARLVQGFALLDAEARIAADTVTNPEAVDPPERSFVRPRTEVVYIRPVQETEFRRAA